MKKYSVKLPKYSRAVSQEEIPILKRLERQHTLLNTAVDPANPEWHEMTLRTRKSMDSFSSSESRSSSSTNSVASVSDRSTTNSNTADAQSVTTPNNNLPVPVGVAMVITDTDLASSWLYKRRKGMFDIISEHGEGGTCNEAFETSLTDSVTDSPPSIPAPPPPPPPTPNQVSPASNFKQPFILTPDLLLPKVQKFREEDSPEDFSTAHLKPIPIAKKRRSRSTCCCYLTVLLIAFVCMFGLLSAIGGIIYLEVFTSPREVGQTKDTRANFAGSMFKDYVIPGKTKFPKDVESERELNMLPDYIPSTQSSYNIDETTQTSANIYRTHGGESSDDGTISDHEVITSVPGSIKEISVTRTETDDVMSNSELDQTEKNVKRFGERFEPDSAVVESNNTNIEQQQPVQNALGNQTSDDCDYAVGGKSGIKTPCRITLQVSEDVVPVVRVIVPLKGSRSRQKPNETVMDSSDDQNTPEITHGQLDVNSREITHELAGSEDVESPAVGQLDVTTGLSFVHSIIETKPLTSTEASMKNTQPTPVSRDLIAPGVHLPVPTTGVDQSMKPVFHTEVPDDESIDNSNDVEMSSVNTDDNMDIEFVDTEDREMFPEYSLMSESDEEANPDSRRSQGPIPVDAVSGINIPAPPIRLPQSPAGMFPNSFDKIINTLKQTNSRQSLINQRQMTPISESGFAKRRLMPDPDQDIFDIQRPKNGRLQESIAAVLKRLQTLENSNFPASRAAGQQRVPPRAPRIPFGADEMEKKLYLDKIREMMYGN